MRESDVDFLSVSAVEFTVLDDDAITLLAAADLDLQDADVDAAVGGLYDDSSHMTNKMAADDDDSGDLAAATALKTTQICLIIRLHQIRCYITFQVLTSYVDLWLGLESLYDGAEIRMCL